MLCREPCLLGYSRSVYLVEYFPISRRKKFIGELKNEFQPEGLKDLGRNSLEEIPHRIEQSNLPYDEFPYYSSLDSLFSSLNLMQMINEKKQTSKEIYLVQWVDWVDVRLKHVFHRDVQ